MKKMISFLTVLVLSIVTMLPVKVMAAEYPHRNSEVKHVTCYLIKQSMKYSHEQMDIITGKLTVKQIREQLMVHGDWDRRELDLVQLL